MSVLHVACVVEGDYVPHTAAMLHSVLAHRGAHDVHVHYLHGPDLRPWTRRRLRRWLERSGAALTLHPVADEQVDGLPTRGFTGKATWYRVLLPDLLGDVGRVLFLDADVIVVDALTELWGTDLEGATVGAVTNVFPPMYVGRAEELGLPGPGAYFNAGVLLLDLDAMRRDGDSARLLDVGRTRADELVLRDQDALNVVLHDRRRALHPRWNAMNSLRFDWSVEVYGLEVLEEARRRPAIRHFEGPDDNKPWHPACEQRDRELYDEHRAETPWRPRLLRA